MRVYPQYSFLLFLFLFGCSNSSKKTYSDIPVIDISAEYPRRSFYIQDIADVEYVPLETRDDVLFDKAGQIVYVSDERIVACNPNLGDVFVYGRDGKILFRFNRRGQSGKEYVHISQIVYDEKNREIYIYSSPSRFLVFSEGGEYKRSLQIIPDTDFILYNFDDETLFAYDRFGTDGGEQYSTQPYLFLSKKDGSTVSSLDRTLPVRYSNYLKTTVIRDGKELDAVMVIQLNGENWHDGKDFVIADLSSDTVFQFTRDKKLSPLIIRTPSVHNENPMIFFAPIVKGDKFIFLAKSVVDLASMKKGGQPVGINRNLLYHFLNKEVYEASIVNRDYPANIKFPPRGVDIGKNMAAALIPAHEIVYFLERGEIKGALLPTAQKLEAEDNPVLMIMKFK
ncbi:MAG: 6-bladed beta-propeller [Bacteroidales bacterium]|jgi:hypothetical protein|nr:6-bladed beta-propeller [Bacteroidales bacterium]